MQTLIKVSNKIKWYYIKLTSPLSSFKKWFLADITQTFAELNNTLDNKIDNLESKIDIDDIVSRVEDLEYYDFDEIQERAENAERKAEENDHMIESVKDRSETNQESIKHLKDKIDQLWAYDEMFKILKDDIKTIKKVDFAGIADRFDELDERVEDNKLKIVQTQIDLQCDKNNLEYLNNREDKQPEPLLRGQEYFQEYDEGKQERSEQSLSDIQRLVFEICHYYGGEFDVNDFDNCYQIVNEYDVVWKRNPQPKKQGVK